jgi:hypothetical protein
MLVDEAAFPHLTDLIYAVGKLETAILYRDFSAARRQISAVDVSDT